MGQALANNDRRSLMSDMAKNYGMDKAAFESTLRKTIMPANATNEQIAAFLIVAKEYDLNPFTKEIYAFQAGGGIQPIVSVDGWLKIINENPDCDGFELEETFDSDGKIYSVTCRMYRKGRAHPIVITEYLSECERDTAQWKSKPIRMLRHKATIQAARYAFGFSGILDQDEAEQIVDMGEADLVRSEQATKEKQAELKEKLASKKPKETEVVDAEIVNQEAANDPEQPE